MSESLREKAKRHPQTFNRLLGLALLLCLICLAVVTVIFQGEQSRSSQSATQVALANEAIEAERALAQSRLLALQAREQFEAGDNALALALALEVAKFEPPPVEVERVLYDLLNEPGISQVIPLPVPLVKYEEMPGVYPLDISPDATFALYATGTELVKIDPTTGEILARMPYTDRINFITLSPDNRVAILAHETCLSYDLAKSAVTATIIADYCYINRFSPDGSYLFMVTDDGRQRLYRTDTWELVIDFEPNLEECCVLREAVFSPDSQSILTLSKGVLRLWDISRREVLQLYNDNRGLYRLIGFYQAGFPATDPTRHVLGIRSRSSQGNVTNELVDIAISADPEQPMQVSTVRGDLWSDAMLAPDEERLAVSRGDYGSSSNAINEFIFTYRTAVDQAWSLKNAGGPVMRFTPAGDEVLVATRKGQILRIDLNLIQAAFADLTYLPFEISTAGLPHTDLLTILADGTTVLVNTLALLNLQTDVSVFERGEILPLAASPDGKLLVGVDITAYQISLLDAASGAKIRDFEFAEPVYPDGVRLAFSPDNAHLALNTGKQLVIFDTATGQVVTTVEDETYSAYPYKSLAYSRDGRYLLITGLDLVDVLTPAGEPVLRYDAVPGLQRAAFAPDSQSLYLAQPDQIQVVDITTGTLARTMTFNRTISAVEFSADADIGMLYDDPQDEVVLFSPSSGQVILAWHYPYISSDNYTTIPFDLALSPSGDTMALMDGGYIQSWTIPTLPELIDLAHENRYIPEFTCDQRTYYRITPLCDVEPTPAP